MAPIECSNTATLVVLLSPTLTLSDAARSSLRERSLHVVSGLGDHSEIAHTVSMRGISTSVFASNPVVASFVHHMVLMTNPTNYAAACTALADAPEDTWQPSKIVCPFFVLHGENDYMVAEQDARNWTEAVGAYQSRSDEVVGSRLRQRPERFSIMKGIGHWGAIEAPELVARNLIRFILD